MKVTEEKIIIEDNVITIRAKHTGPGGYHPHVDLLCTITDNGNGFTAYFPSYSNAIPENYICLDYCEADYIVNGLKKYYKKQRKDRENAT